MNTVTVKINGMEYNLKGKENDEYLLKVADYVDGKFKEVSNNNNKLSLSSVAVLSALNIADELFKCDKEVEDLLSKGKSLEETNRALKQRALEMKKQMECAIENKDNEMASLKEMLYVLEQRSREAEILNDRVADLTEELEEKSKLEDEVNNLRKEIEILRNINGEQDSEIEEMEYTISVAEKNNKELSTSLLNAQDEIAKEKEENNMLLAKIAKLEEEIAAKISKEEYNNVLNNYNVSQENIEQMSKEKNEIETMLEEFKINIKDIETENESLKESKNTLAETIALKEEEIEKYKSKSSLDEEEAKSLKEKILELEESLIKGKEQRRALLNRDKDIKFQLQNFKYKVLDLEKKLIDLQIELTAERRKSNPLLK